MSLLALVPALFLPDLTSVFDFGLPPPTGLASDQDCGRVQPVKVNKSSSMPHLAVELQNVILSYLPRQSILALTLSHPSLRGVCEPYLWRTLHLQSSMAAPALGPRLLSLLAVLRAEPRYAAHVRTLNVDVGPGEAGDGSEWAIVGEIAALLPDVREVDWRSDSVGRWKGILDPCLQIMFDRGRNWPRLERLSVSALVGDTSLVRRWLETCGASIKEIEIDLTHISPMNASQQAAQGHQPYDHAFDLSVVGSDERWSLNPVRLPPPPHGHLQADTRLLPSLETYIGSVTTLASILSFEPHACPELSTIKLDSGHPFGEDARRTLAEEMESTLSGRNGVIKILVLTDGIQPGRRMLAGIGRAVGEGLEVLRMGDPIGFVYAPPPSPLSPKQLTAFPTLQAIEYEAWGYFDQTFLSSLPHDPDYPVLLTSGQQKVALFSFRYEVVHDRDEGGRKAVFKKMRRVEVGGRELGEPF